MSRAVNDVVATFKLKVDKSGFVQAEQSIDKLKDKLAPTGAGKAPASSLAGGLDRVEHKFKGFGTRVSTTLKKSTGGFKVLEQNFKAVGKQAGGVVCGPVWRAFMEKALEKYPVSDFPTPDGAMRVRLCLTSGRLAAKSCPGAAVVQQVYPSEALPAGECPFHGGGGD